MRSVVLWVTLVFTGLLGFLTMYVLFTSGPDILTVFSIGVLAIFISAIVGALREPPS